MQFRSAYILLQSESVFMTAAVISLLIAHWFPLTHWIPLIWCKGMYTIIQHVFCHIKYQYSTLIRRAAIAQWLARWTRDWKVAGLNPRRSGGGENFLLQDQLSVLTYDYPFHPRVTAVARKRSQPFCQKCRWQVTDKYAYNLHMWFCRMKWLDMVVWCTQNMRRDGSSFMWHHWVMPVL